MEREKAKAKSLPNRNSPMKQTAKEARAKYSHVTAFCIINKAKTVSKLRSCYILSM